MRKWLVALPVLAGLSAYGSDAARHADLDFVASRLPQLHANFFYQLDPAAFQAAADALAADLPNLTDAEFYVRLAALIAMAGDPHTAIYLNNSAAAMGFQQFPLLFVSLDDGVFVSQATDSYARALGAQLTAVGGVPIDQVVQKLGTLIPHRNEGWLRYYSQSYLRGQQILQGLHIAPAGATTPLTFRTLAGETFTLDVAAGAIAPASPRLPDPNGLFPRYMQGNNQNYWFVYEPANRMLYFRYSNCTNMPILNPFPAFAANLLATLDSNPVDTMVLDLRQNTGGDSSVWDPLLTGLVQRMPGLLAKPQFRIYAAVDNGTFSSGSLDAMLLKSSIPQAQIIGEPTGGSAGGYGNATAFTLPGSGLVGQYSTSYVDPPPAIAPGSTIAPDIAIGIRSTDFFARYDPVMGAILARTDHVPAAPSGGAIAVNGASFRADQALAPGSYAAVFGTFGHAPDTVLVAGIAAQIASAAATQVNIVVPASTPVGSANISVRADGREVATGQVVIASAAPGLFVLTADPWQPGAVENQDFSVNSASNPAAVGSIVSIYATGAGPVDGSGNVPVSVFFGDYPAEVVASVPLAAYPGLWQINARVPPLPAMGQIPVFAIAGGTASNAATLQVR